MSQPRIITINTSTGAPAQQISTIAQTWGELQIELSNANISYSGMKAIVGETRVALESNNAQLPAEGTFNIFLLPKKTKSGSTKKVTEKVVDEKLKSTKLIDKKAPVKKAVVKKGEEKAASRKKAAPKKTTTIKIEETIVEEVVAESPLKQAAKRIAEEVKKELTDVEKATSAIQLLKSIKNPASRVLIDKIVIEIDDVAYIIATGRPRIDTIRNRQTNDLLAREIPDVTNNRY